VWKGKGLGPFTYVKGVVKTAKFNRKNLLLCTGGECYPTGGPRNFPKKEKQKQVEREHKKSYTDTTPRRPLSKEKSDLEDRGVSERSGSQR